MRKSCFIEIYNSHVHLSSLCVDVLVVPHIFAETQMKFKIDELDSTLKEIQNQYSLLQKNFQKEESEKLVRVMKILDLISGLSFEASDYNLKNSAGCYQVLCE